MGFLKLFGGHKDNSDNNKNDTGSHKEVDNMNIDPEKIDAYRNIVKLIDVNGATADRLEKCFADPRVYYHEYQEKYDDRFIGEDDDIDLIVWIGMVDAFQDNGLLEEMDWKVEIDEFIGCVSNILNDKPLTINEDWFDEDDGIPEWGEMLNSKWSDAGYVLAGIDIDSDSYCMFITDKDSYNKLVTEAQKAGHRIALAENM